MNLMFKLFVLVHVALFRMTGGRLGRTLAGKPVLLLTTTGNKSGKQRTVPVMWFNDGGDAVVVASKGGSPTHPAWYNNLVKNPEVTVEVPGRRYRARAVALTGEERDRLYRVAVEQMPQFGGYEEKARGHREIPVVRLKESAS